MNELSIPKRVLVAGAAGMVGSAICRKLEAANIDYRGVIRADADLTDRNAVDRLINEDVYDCLVIAAARVGGIHANDTYPADFIFDNLTIEANLIDSAFRHNINRIIFLGSSCIYPREAEQPMKESALLTGPLEPTNEAYAIAKIAGIKLCESYNRQHGTDYRSLMPTNLYGPGDNFHPENSHVIPALIQRFHEAKLAGDSKVKVWGSGKPRREFLHVDDLATATVYTLSLPETEFWSAVDPRCSHVNVGTGTDVSIAELSLALRTVIGLNAELEFDSSKPDGTARKLLDVETLSSLGWKASIGLEAGLMDAYAWYLDNTQTLRI